jgi:hypothetical protein
VKSKAKTKGSKGRSGAGDGDMESPIVLRPESEEMIVVTYEEGLAKLGLVRPHHILYPNEHGPTEPLAFEETRQAYPVVSPRAVTGRTGLRGTERGEERDRRHRIISAERVKEWARSPLDKTPMTATSEESGVTRPGVAGIGAGHQHDVRGAGGQRGKGSHQSTWLPSYYHTPERVHPQLPEESELGYRSERRQEISPGRDQWITNRI